MTCALPSNCLTKRRRLSISWQCHLAAASRTPRGSSRIIGAFVTVTCPLYPRILHTSINGIFFGLPAEPPPPPQWSPTQEIAQGRPDVPGEGPGFVLTPRASRLNYKTPQLDSGHLILAYHTLIPACSQYLPGVSLHRECNIIHDICCLVSKLIIPCSRSLPHYWPWIWPLKNENILKRSTVGAVITDS